MTKSKIHKNNKSPLLKSTEGYVIPALINLSSTVKGKLLLETNPLIHSPPKSLKFILNKDRVLKKLIKQVGKTASYKRHNDTIINI